MRLSVSFKESLIIGLEYHVIIFWDAVHGINGTRIKNMSQDCGLQPEVQLRFQHIRDLLRRYGENLASYFFGSDHMII